MPTPTMPRATSSLPAFAPSAILAALLILAGLAGIGWTLRRAEQVTDRAFEHCTGTRITGTIGFATVRLCAVR